jgi:hypothetical protein
MAEGPKQAKAAYDHARQLSSRLARERRKKKAADYQAAHPEIVTEHNIAITRSWWGQEDGT